MFQIAVYGKGGIGKSTISANLSYALARNGKKVIQIGCDPKHDSTRLLLKGMIQTTVLSYIRDVPPPDRRLEDVLKEGILGIRCVEAGGPEPGIGCAGRGILSTFDALKKMGLDEHEFDFKLYDVLGDVVCGGFAVPLRREYADAVYLVTSGEFMSIYAANNILKGIRNFDGTSSRVAGLIFNGRGLEGEKEIVDRFAHAVGLPIVAYLPRSQLFSMAEREASTLVELFPESGPARVIAELSRHVINAAHDPSVLSPARPLDDEQLNELAAGKEVSQTERRQHGGSGQETLMCPSERQCTEVGKASSSNMDRKIIHTCATNGAVHCTSQIDKALTIIHGPRSCAHIMAASSDHYALSSWKRNGEVQVGPTAYRLSSTDMDDHISIFGGAQYLERFLRQKAEQGHRTMFVITTCASGIIGDDVASVARRVEEDHEGMVVKVIEADGNITGEWDQGYLDAVKIVTELVDRNVRPEKGMVNLIGERDFFIYNRERNFQIAREVLGRMGLRVNCRFLSDCDVASIRNFYRGGLNLMAQNDALSKKMGEMLKERLGVQVFDLPLPVGLRETVTWVKKLSCTMGREGAGREMIEELTKEYQEGIQTTRPWLKDKKVLVVNKFAPDIDWLLDLLTDLEVRVLKIGLGMRHYPGEARSCLDSMSTAYVDRLDFQEDYGLADLKQDISSLTPDLVLTDQRIPRDQLCHYDLVYRPDIGIRSSLDLAKRWANIVRLPEMEGWKMEEME